MDNVRTAINVAPADRCRWWKRITGKPLGEILTDLMLFVIGVGLLYSIDFLIISRAAPVAIRGLVDLVVYLNHHAAAAIEILN